MNFGKSIRIYLKDATVTGIRFGEIVNNTIQCVACPRNRIAELKNYPEANKPGVYFLFGKDDLLDTDMAYIGEAENVYDRLQNHLNTKDFWREVVFFVSKDENLTKAHVRYLESRVIQIANSTKRYKIENYNQTQQSPLPIADRDTMEEFLTYLNLLLGVFGHKLLEEPAPIRNIESTELANVTSNVGSSNIKSIELFLSISSLKASALYTDEGIVVLEGSEAAKEVTVSMPMGYRELRQKLISNGTMVLEGDKYIFKNKWVFDTASPAAAVIVGYSINGRDCWKDSIGRSLKEVEKQRLNANPVLN